MDKKLKIIEQFVKKNQKKYLLNEQQSSVFKNINVIFQRQVLQKYNVFIQVLDEQITLIKKKQFKDNKIGLLNPKTNYIRPLFFNDIINNLSYINNPTEYKAKNFLFHGHKGTGKTSCVYQLLQIGLFDAIYQQNGSNQLSIKDFLGCKTVSIDFETKQNHITFDKGVLYKAFIHGTELDENGNQVLYNGEPKVIGKPALYFLDQFELVPPQVLTSVFNRALSIPLRYNQGRTLEINQENKIIKSHPGFTIVFASNLIGKGISSSDYIGYSSQTNIHDDSTLDRFNLIYEFGFNLLAEQNIIKKNINDDKIANNFIRFVEKMRYSWETSTIDTLISTRSIDNFCENYKLYFNLKDENPLEKSFINSFYNKLSNDEKDAWSIAFDLCMGTKVKSCFANYSEQLRYVKKIVI